MTVEIPPDLQQFVHQVIDAGSYKSEAEVVGQALRLLQERQRRIEELRREIQPALDRLRPRRGNRDRSEDGLDGVLRTSKARSQADWKRSERNDDSLSLAPRAGSIWTRFRTISQATTGWPRIG